VTFADVLTYRVVRSIKYFNQASQAPPITANYQWVPRTPAMVRLVNNPVIPAGFCRSPSATSSLGPLARTDRDARERRLRRYPPGPCAGLRLDA
jgi:hypothetical protein